VVTTTADLAVLTGSGELVGNAPGLLVADDLVEAVAAVEDLAMPRAAQVANRTDPADVSRTVLLAGSPTDPQTARRVQVLLTLGADKAVTGVLLGEWGPGATWHIGPGGLVDTDDDRGPAARLSVLGAAATGDLLAVYREAHTPRRVTTAPGDVRQAGDAGMAAPARVPRQVPARDGQPPSAAAPRVDRVRLTALGPPVVFRPGEIAPVRWPRSAAVQVLVFLAVYPVGASSTDLAEMLWPELPTDTTTNRVYNIMRSVHEALDGAAGGPTIVRAGDRYRLNPQHVDVDLWRLREAIRAAGASPDPTVQAAGARRVIDAYTGDLADGWGWPWLDPHREATRRHVLDAYTTLAAQSDPAAATRLLHAAAAVDPINDALRQRVADINRQPGNGDITYGR
jgi:DNA-binding SARP family transcriptional activator